MGNWFGNLDLAYKYTIVFLSLLVLTLVAGGIKVLYNRRRMKAYKAAQSEESGRREDQVELNQREKDEGDLFGIRAIEAGFYAGIPQSRPTSRAGSYIDSPNMSNSTLIGAGGFGTPKIQSMANSSVTSLPLAHTRDSDVLPNDNQRRKSPPTIRLAPSEAEMNGRINHNTSVNMGLNVPPSPVLARGPQSPTFGGSDDGESDGYTTPRSLSPNRPKYYAPTAPQIPMPEGLRVTVQDADEMPKSQTASLRNPSPANNTPPSPGPAPQTKLPTMPVHSSTQQPQSMRLQPQTYQPNHQRDGSDASSVYSAHRMSTHEHKKSNSTDMSYNFSHPEKSTRNSMSLNATSKESSRSTSISSSLLAPGSAASNDKTNDPRFSEFYDAYYRHSQIAPAKPETSKRPGNLNLQQDTIVEVPSPLPSPNPEQSLMGHSGPGTAM